MTNEEKKNIWLALALAIVFAVFARMLRESALALFAISFYLFACGHYASWWSRRL
jgi:hypothetical protein